MLQSEDSQSQSQSQSQSSSGCRSSLFQRDVSSSCIITITTLNVIEWGHKIWDVRHDLQHGGGNWEGRERGTLFLHCFRISLSLYLSIYLHIPIEKEENSSLSISKV